MALVMFRRCWSPGVSISTSKPSSRRGCFDPSAVDGDDFDAYVSAYAAPGAMRAGFELYRGFDQDIHDNRAALARNGKLAIAVLAVHGAISNTGRRMEDMMREVVNHVTTLCVEDAGHWVPEENPDGFVKGLLAFLLAKEEAVPTLGFVAPEAMLIDFERADLRFSVGRGIPSLAAAPVGPDKPSCGHRPARPDRYK